MFLLCSHPAITGGGRGVFMERNVEPLMLTWFATLGGMVENKTRVRAWCGTCETMFRVSVPLLHRAYGPDYSLYNVRRRCPIYNCPGTVFFLASPSEGTPFRPLKDDFH